MAEKQWVKIRVPERQGTILGVLFDPYEDGDYWVVYTDGVVSRYDSTLRVYRFDSVPSSTLVSLIRGLVK